MKWLLLLFLLFSSPLAAQEVTFYWLHNLSVQYEGTGYRETPAGWELKVKPQSMGQGVRWRNGAVQFQAWKNNPYFSWEDGNSAGALRRQTGQTRLGFQSIQLDLRLPLSGSRMEAVGGLLTTRTSLERKDVVFDGLVDPGAQERISGAGPLVGLHASARKPLGSWILSMDGEAATARFLWSRNRLKTGGGSISQGGFAYLFRFEAGIQRGTWRLGLGVLRQMHEILTQGGLGLPNGAAASLPINKFDLTSPFLSLTWELP